MRGFLPLGRAGGGAAAEEEEEVEFLLLSLLLFVETVPLTLTHCSGSHEPSSRAPPPSCPPMQREKAGVASSVGRGGREEEEASPLLEVWSAPAAPSCEGKLVLAAPIPRIPSATCWKISPVSLVVQPKVTGTRRYSGEEEEEEFFFPPSSLGEVLLKLELAAPATSGSVTRSVTSLPDALDSSAYSLLQVQFPSRLASSESGAALEPPWSASQPHCCLDPQEHFSASPHFTRSAVALAAASKPEPEECLGPQSPVEAQPEQAT